MANFFESAYSTLATLFGGHAGQPTLDVTTPAAAPAPELLRASSPAELADKALEYQQTGFLHGQYLQITAAERDRKLSYESTRRAQYFDYVAMESYPIIRTALDVLAEEATTAGEDGKVLKVYSSNKRVKQVLENLFENVLDVNTTLHATARNLCKYGDDYKYLLLDPEHGVMGYKQLSALDIERKEEIKNNKVQVSFKHQNLNGRSDEYTIWQIAHFRLLSDERRMPYGMSVLDGVRRTWKMLTMCEDAMMVYRITRAGERRIFKVFVGNAKSEQEVKQIMQAVMRQHKSSRLTGPDGQINYQFNVASVDQDIYIPVRSENAANPIETLPGAQNLDAISDISYLRDNLFTGLGIQKAFLAFSEEGGGGEGKSLAMLDIRFARKVNRIQQALVAELNKIAIIHLGLLGGDYLEHLGNFTLTLANPSTQSELLKLEVTKGRLEAYQMAVTPSDKGIAPMSESLAARTILGMSDEERLDDLLEQFVETKVGDEIKSSGQLLKSSQMYDKIIKFKNAGFGMEPTSPGGEGGDPNAPGGELGGPDSPPDMNGPDLGGGGGPDMNGPPDLGGGGGGGGGNAPGAGPLSEQQLLLAGGDNLEPRYRAFLLRESVRKARAASKKTPGSTASGPSQQQLRDFAQEIERRHQERTKIQTLSTAVLRKQADLEAFAATLRK